MVDTQQQVSRGENSAVHGSGKLCTEGTSTSVLNVNAASFVMKNPSLVHKGVLLPNLDECWEQVQRVQAGGAGDQCEVTIGSPVEMILGHGNH